jgi:hypothetical protein
MLSAYGFLVAKNLTRAGNHFLLPSITVYHLKNLRASARTGLVTPQVVIPNPQLARSFLMVIPARQPEYASGGLKQKMPARPSRVRRGHFLFPPAKLRASCDFGQTTNGRPRVWRTEARSPRPYKSRVNRDINLRHMKDSFLTTIQNEYGFLIQGCREAARGQVAAETYILLDKKDRRYFCKITDRPDFISMIGPTLPVVRV